MSDKPHEWGGEHFCGPDAKELYYTEPNRVTNVGFPVELDSNPVPPTFCSACLLWFDDPAHLTGSEHRPPESKGTANG